MKVKKRAIRIPGTVPREDWGIPVSKKARDVEQEAMKNYQAYENFLEDFGFEKMYQIQSLPHSLLSFDRKTVPEMYSLWIHKEGIIAKIDSSTKGGYVKQDGTIETVTTTIGSVEVTTMMDIGTGEEVQHRAACNLSGSGGVHLQLDGSQIREIHDSFHSNTRGGISTFLEKIQAYGKLVPVSKWGDLLGAGQVFLDNEFIYPISTKPDVEIKKTSDLMEGLDKDKLLKDMLVHLPKNIQSAFLKNEDLTSGRMGLVWDPVEYSLKKFSEALFFGKKKWRGQYDTTLLTHWSEVALGDQGEDPADWRAYETGPANLSLPVALIHADEATGSPERLIKLLEEAPLDVLHRWATVPDKAGYTLALHAVARLFFEQQSTRRKAKEGMVEAVFDILHRRLGNDGLVMQTDKRSILGIPIQFDEEPTKSQATQARKNVHETHTEFTNLVIKLETWGVSWDQHVRWRDYPNTMTTDGRNPMFFRVDGPITVDDWKALMGERYKSNLNGVCSILNLRQLEKILGETQEKTVVNKETGPRIKM